VPPKAPDKVLEGSLVHQGEWLPSKFSRLVPEQAKQDAAEVQAIQEKKRKSARNLMKSMAAQTACSRIPPKEGKYQEVKSNRPKHEGNHRKEGGR
jgi:hypothetical protein